MVTALEERGVSQMVRDVENVLSVVAPSALPGTHCLLLHYQPRSAKSVEMPLSCSNNAPRTT